MKNKKGFTLIELLAIIVILAIIAVITVPIILNVIENSKKGAAIDSAYGYKNSVMDHYTTLLALDNSLRLNGQYTVSNGILTGNFGGTIESKNIPVSGTKPTSGTLVYTNSVLTGGCLIIDDYAVSFGTDGKVSNAVKGTCGNGEQENIITYTDTDGDENISLGDRVMIGDDGFWVIAPPKNGKVKLLAEYNLDSNSRQSEKNYIVRRFSSTNYWWVKGDYDSSNYSQDLQGEYYVYRTSTGAETNNNLKTYINNYKNYLISLGTTNIEDARLMSYEEAVGTGCTTSSNSCPTYVANQSYWLGSANGNDSVLYVNKKRFLGNGWYSGGNNDSRFGGIRPLVIINESTLIGE